MTPEALVQLVESGNTATVEEAWLRLIESSQTTPVELARYGCVVESLVEEGNGAAAEALVSMSLDVLAERCSPEDVLTVAGPWLRALRNSEAVRKSVADLYRKAHAGGDALETLLQESGIEGGRPVRRALRTLDVILSLKVGDYLIARDEDHAARVERIETPSWEITITDGRRAETLGPVPLADRFRRVEASDITVMRQFAADQLQAKLKDNPASILVDLCRRHGNVIDSDRLEDLLVPSVIEEEDWKKWFSKARSALKKIPHIKMEGRAPVTITYVDSPAAAKDQMVEEFMALKDPVRKLGVVEQYLRECSVRKEAPDAGALNRCYQAVAGQLERAGKGAAASACLLGLVARRLGEAAGVEGASESANRAFRSVKDLGEELKKLDDSLFDLACVTLREAHPQTWRDDLWSALPDLSAACCERAAKALIEAGATPKDFEAVVQGIVGSPLTHFEALLWLWDGPGNGEIVTDVRPLTLLSRILSTLEECRRSDHVSKETARCVALRARAVLSARKYERVRACLEGLDAGRASALRTQIRRLDNLGRVVREDLLRLIERQCPRVETPAEITPPWELEDVVFVTERGFARKQEEIDHLVNVKMKENARAIGAAAEHGDLSENSEYKFALEERDLLRARLAQMNLEMSRVRVLTPADVPKDRIGIGSRVVFERLSDGARYEMTFVGPWDADGDRGLYNYQAPLAKSLMGTRLGEEVELNHGDASGRYRVTELHNAVVELAEAPSG